jgi:hypothetical protein
MKKVLIVITLLLIVNFICGEETSMCKHININHFNISARGCCSRNGGVCGCINGKIKCCNGKISPTCKCN